MENGYLYVSGEWKEGDLLKLRFAMKVKVMQADSRVRQDEGKVAIMRGPVVYCLEEADNGQGLPLVRVKHKKKEAGNSRKWLISNMAKASI